MSERGKLQLRALAQVEREWRDCDKCELAATRRKVVFWRGNPNAKLILIGESPGENEELTGRPFTGPAGRLLDSALVSAGLDPAEDVWIANVIGCRPPGNRRPTLDEISSCRPRLYQMQDAVTGRVVLLLGAAAGSLAGVRSAKDWRGEELDVTFHGYDPASVVELPGFIAPHPSYVLRSGGNGSQAYKDLVSDIKSAFSRANQ